MTKKEQSAFTLAESSRRLLVNGEEGVQAFPRLVKDVGFTKPAMFFNPLRTTT